ncbi:hypothetical protein [Solibacillus sp. R5-41]|nr:hypothetical protein [Solibacillus sp. R5-41]
MGIIIIALIVGLVLYMLIQAEVTYIRADKVKQQQYIEQHKKEGDSQ